MELIQRDRVRDRSVGAIMKSLTVTLPSNVTAQQVFDRYGLYNFAVNYTQSRPSEPCSLNYYLPKAGGGSELVYEYDGPPRTTVSGNYHQMGILAIREMVASVVKKWEAIIALDFGSGPGTVSVLRSNDRDFMSDVVTSNFHQARSKNIFTYTAMVKDVTTSKYESAGVSSTDSAILYAYTAVASPWVTKTCSGGTVVNIDDNSDIVAPVYGFTLADELALRQSVDLTSQKADALHVSLSKAKSDFTSADLDALIALAEAPDTIMTLYRLLKSAKEIVSTIKSGKWMKYAPKLWRKLKKQSVRITAYNSAKYSADIWLEMRYAIRPIYYDIVGLLKVIEGNKSVAPYQTFRGYHAIEDFETGFVTGGTNPEDTPGDFYYESSYEVSARAGIFAELLTDDLTAKSLGLSNVGSLVWDSITLSFILGWFIDIGQLLYDVNPSTTFSEKGVWVTVKTTQTFRGYKVVADGEETRTLAFELDVFNTERTIDPESRYFTVNINLDVPKLIDIASLLLSFKSLKKLSAR